MKALVFSFILTILFAGCSSNRAIPYQSKWKSHTLFYSQSPTDEVDMKSRLKFGVQNNDEKLFASVSTREPELISRIISSGMRLTVHPTDSKKSSYKILFPVVLKEDRRALRKMDNVDMLGPSMQLLLDTFNKEALVSTRGSSERFVNLISDGDLYCKISMTVDGELSIDYAIPLKEINPSNGPNLSLSLAVEGASSRSGITPGISIGMGAGGYGGMGGVSVGTGGRNAYGNQGVELKIDVNLAKSGS
jgi:hypothetical protein